MLDKLPQLNAQEIRIIGCLIEKSKTTPEYYPLSLNALTNACNQKSARKPVVNYTEEEVHQAINNLKAISLVSYSVGGTSRTNKYKHNFATLLSFTDAQMAVLCLLFLRGPLTPGEINSNSVRLHEFSSLESVVNTLNNLSEHTPPLVKLLERKPGQKEARYIHLFGEYEEQEEEQIAYPASTDKSAELTQQIINLESEVEELKSKVNFLYDKLKDLI